MTHLPSNPIHSAAIQVAAEEHALSSITVVAPLIGGKTIMAISIAGMTASQPESLDGVTMTDLQRQPDRVRSLPAMADPETLCIGSAWSFGAWDIVRTTIDAGYKGTLPPYMAEIAQDSRTSGYVTWTWRPIFAGPEIRKKANGKRDTTLDPFALNRNTPMPPVVTRRLTGNNQMILTLGKAPSSPKTSHPPALATVKQRGYLGRLLRNAGEDDTLPHDLTLAQASAMIDRLAPNRKRKRPATANQINMIYRLANLTNTPVRPGDIMQTSYDDAAALIRKLQDKR